MIVYQPYYFICNDDDCGNRQVKKVSMWSDNIQPPYCINCGNVMVEYKEVKVNTFLFIGGYDEGRHNKNY